MNFRQYENTRVLRLPQVEWGRKLPPATLTLTLCLTLTYDSDLDICDRSTCDLDLGPHTRLKTKIFNFLTMVTLTYDLDLQTRPRYDGP